MFYLCSTFYNYYFEWIASVFSKTHYNTTCYMNNYSTCM